MIEDADVPDGEAPDLGPVDCDPALRLIPEDGFAAAYDLLILDAEGGTGSYRFELVENNSGAIINDLTGAYLAGAVNGVEDRVRLTDTGCIGEAFATVRVTDPLEIRPKVVAVESGQVIRFDAFGGSGQAEYSMVINNSLAMVTPEGEYTAGPRLGRDVVKLRDPETGLEDEAVISVVDDPTLSADPPRLFLPVGATIPLSFTGGSGFFDVERRGISATYDEGDNTVTGLVQGRTTFTLVDRYTPQRIEIAVDVSAPLEAPLGRAGRGQSAATVHGPGDLDGNGYADAIIGHPEPSIEAFADGAVFVYRGGPQGLSADPVQVFSGASRDEQFGRSVATADVDADGQVDLMIGSWNEDSNGGNAGAVHIYRGIEGGFFEDLPIQTLYGPRGGDQFGLALAVCDFNGDRLPDLAVSAYNYEDRGAEPVTNNQGAVHVFLGSEAGFRDEADGGILVGGILNEGGDYVGRANLRLGDALAAGDIDGDGICDLAASSASYNIGGNNSGAIYLYRGRAPDPRSEDLGGLDLIPAVVYAGTGSNSLGRRLAVADVNGDRRADVIAAHHGFDAQGRNNAGAVRVFSGGPLAGPVRQFGTQDDAAWVWEGDVGNDQRGIAVAAGLWTPDPVPDIIVGTWNDEPSIEGATPDVGSVIVIPGVAGRWPDPEPVFEVYGEEQGALFGEAVAMLGDVDGDAEPDLAVTAARAQALGINVGRPFFVSGGTGATRPLDLPGAPAGAWNGYAVAAVGDVDGDGLSDLVVGAPETPLLPNQLRAGAAYLYRGVEGGYDTEPAVTFSGHFGHSAVDRFGFGAAGGDFDGDNRRDVFIAAANEDRPGNFDPELFALDGDCAIAPGTGNGNDRGTVYIYRGGPDGVDGSRPDYVYYGPRQGAQMSTMLVVDINDDGNDDLIVGGELWDSNGNDAGGIQVIYGRQPDADGRIRVLCDPAFTFTGRVGGARTGRSLTLMGDIDVDGCNDIAFGAFNENIDRTPQPGDETPQGGAVRILFGWNGDGCAPRPRMLTFAGDGNRPQAGFSISAGNVIGSATADLVVGAVNHVDVDNVRVGAVYVVDGDFIAALDPEPAERALPNVFPLGEGDTRRILYGQTPAEQFGRSVLAVGGRVIASRAFGQVGEATRIGGADIIGFGGFDLPVRVAHLSGETWRQESRIGEVVVQDPTRPLVTIAGFQASGLATDAGAVYVYNLSGLR